MWVGIVSMTNRQRGGAPAESLWANTERIDLPEQLLLHRGPKRVGMPLVQRRSSARLAQRATLSKLPPTPTPTTIGGQGFGPAFLTVSSTKSLTPCAPSLGRSIRSAPCFSLPNPLGATVISQASPGTRSTVSSAGVLSPV